MCSAILLAGIRSPVIGEIKNCSLAVGAAVAGLGAEIKIYTCVYLLCIYLRRFMSKNIIYVKW